MNSAALKYLAAFVVTGMVVVPFLGLDNLPRNVRSQIVAERAALTDAQNKLAAAQQEVTGKVEGDPDLFRAVPASQGWPAQLGQSRNDLQSAASKAIATMATACKTEMPTTTKAGLEMMDNRLEIMSQVVRTLRPAFDAFYASLDSKQQQRLDVFGPRHRSWRW